MTARELLHSIGTQVYVEPLRGLRVLCQVTDAKSEYGHSRLEIEPLAGEGRAWVNASSTRPVTTGREAGGSAAASSTQQEGQ